MHSSIVPGASGPPKAETPNDFKKNHEDILRKIRMALNFNDNIR